MNEVENFSLRATHAFLEATKSHIKRFYSSGLISFVWDAFADPPPLALNWSIETITDGDVSALFEIIGDNCCNEVTEIVAFGHVFCVRLNSASVEL